MLANTIEGCMITPCLRCRFLNFCIQGDCFGHESSNLHEGKIKPFLLEFCNQTCILAISLPWWLALPMCWPNVWSLDFWGTQRSYSEFSLSEFIGFKVVVCKPTCIMWLCWIIKSGFPPTILPCGYDKSIFLYTPLSVRSRWILLRVRFVMKYPFASGI